MLYQLRFFDAGEEQRRILQIETADDSAAIRIGAIHCIDSGMAVEISAGDKYLFRITPLTARLYLSGVSQAE